MKKMFVFVGDGGSGKTVLATKLEKKYPDRFKKVVTCTSRTPRVGEIDGVDYHFLPEECFVNNPGLLLVKKTDKGDYYGTRRGDLISDTHNLILPLRPTGVRKLSSLGIHNIIVVHILITEDLKIERMRHRGDSEEAIACRLESDVLDNIEINWTGLEVISLQASTPLAEKVERILRAC
jgi:guanylate kinase